jgi:hypothetical protein
MSVADRAAATAAVLSIGCCAAAFWAPAMVIGEGADLTNNHTDVIALVAKVLGEGRLAPGALGLLVHALIVLANCRFS